jgi:chromosome segregation ATPase
MTTKSPTLTTGVINAACTALMKRGVRPTINTVRRETGIQTGSNSTLQKLINAWYADMRDSDLEALTAGQAIQVDLPSELVEAVRHVYQSITEQAETTTASVREALRADRQWVDEQLADVVAQYHAQETALTALRSTIDHEVAQREHAQARAAHLEHEYSAMKADYRALTEQYVALQHQSQIERQHWEHQNQALASTADMAKAAHRMGQSQATSERKLRLRTYADLEALLAQLTPGEADTEVVALIRRQLDALREQDDPQAPKEVQHDVP